MVEVPIFSHRRHGGDSTTTLRSALRMYLGAIELWRRAAMSRGAATRTPPARPARRRLARPGAGREPVERGRRGRPAHCCARRVRGAGSGRRSPRRARRSSSRASTSTWCSRCGRGGAVRGRARACRCRIPRASPSTRRRGVVHVAAHAQSEPGLSTWRRPPRRQSASLPRRRAPLVPVRRVLPGALPARPGADRRRAPRQRRRTERGRPPRRRRRRGPRVWWPRCIETRRRPGLRAQLPPAQFDRGGPGRSRGSFFSASGGGRARRAGPGHRDFPVDRRGVVFSGATREVVARGLTRPHSARLHDGRLWVDNSGYGEVGVVERRRLRRRSPGCPAGRAAWRSTATSPSSAPRASCRASGSTPRPRPRRAASAASTPSTSGTGACWAASSGRRATRSSRSSAFPGRFATGLAVRDRGGARPALRELALFSTFETRASGGAHRMSADFRLLMLGAMYENGGNTTHRFLDGHPELFVYPFESQVGTRLVNDQLIVDLPGQVPLAGLRARRDARRGLPGDHRRGGQGPGADAAGQQVPPHAVRLLRRRALPALRRPTSRGPGGRAPTTWPPSSAPPSRPGRTSRAAAASGSTSATARSSPSTRDKILTDLPQAHVLHVVRNPWSAYADTKKRPVPLVARRTTCWLDAQPVPRAARSASGSRAGSTSCAPRT